jgi:hypothetical protein
MTVPWGEVWNGGVLGNSRADLVDLKDASGMDFFFLKKKKENKNVITRSKKRRIFTHAFFLVFLN